MEYRTEVEQFVAGIIFDANASFEASTGFCFNELSVAKTLEEMDDDDLIEMFYEYPSKYDNFNELISDIERRYMAERTTCVITRADRIRLGEVDKTKSLTENFHTVISLYERACWSPERIDASGPSEMSDAEYVIKRALEVLHDNVPEEDEWT